MKPTKNYLINTPTIDMLQTKMVLHLYAKSDRKKGLITAVYGEPGSGRTFFLNLLKQRLHEKTDPLGERAELGNDYNFDNCDIGVNVQTVLINCQQIQDNPRPTKSILQILLKTLPHSKKQSDIDQISNDLLHRKLAFEFDKFHQQLSQQMGDQKRIILMDNLDHCDPEFVLEFLHIIRNYFDIYNFIFVLGVDEQYLAKCLEIPAKTLPSIIHYHVHLPCKFNGLVAKTYNKYFQNTIANVIQDYCPENERKTLLKNHFAMKLQFTFHCRASQFWGVYRLRYHQKHYKHLNTFKIIAMLFVWNRLQPKQLDIAIANSRAFFENLMNFMLKNKIITGQRAQNTPLIVAALYTSIAIAIIQQKHPEILQMFNDRQHVDLVSSFWKYDNITQNYISPATLVLFAISTVRILKVKPSYLDMPSNFAKIIRNHSQIKLSKPRLIDTLQLQDLQILTQIAVTGG